MPIKSEEFQHHVKDEISSSETQSISFCGTRLSGFYFTDAAHAVATMQTQSRLTICPKCKNKLVKILNS